MKARSGRKNFLGSRLIRQGNPTQLTMVPGWLVLLASVAGFLLLFGFLWRLGYEFSAVRSVLSRARYLSLYKYEVSLEHNLWMIKHDSGTSRLELSGSYLKLDRLLPLRISSDWCRFNYHDDSDSQGTTDFSSCTISIPDDRSWAIFVLKRLLGFLRPIVAVKTVDVFYAYRRSSTGNIVNILCNVLNIEIDVCESRGRASKSELCVSESNNSDSIAKFICPGPCECLIKNIEEIDVLVQCVEASYYVDDTTSSLLQGLQDVKGTGVQYVSSSTRLNIGISVRDKVSASLSFKDKTTIQTSIQVGSPFSSKRGIVSGLYASVIIDPFSGKVFQLSLHNFSNISSNSGIRHIGMQVLVRGVSLIALSSTGSSILGDMKDGGDWKLNLRSNQVAVTLLDKTGSTHDSIVQLKSLSVSGTQAAGLSITTTQADIDISARMLSKAVRVYLRLMSLLETPAPASRSSPFVPSCALTASRDPNYMILQRKFFSNCSTPPLVNESLSTAATPAPTGEPMSRSASAMSMDTSTVKNWKAMERIMFESGKVFVSVVLDQIVLRNKDLIQVTAAKLKGTSKISSTGTPFTTICCDGFSVSDNVVMDGAMRVWIDGNVSSELSRVFCLIPPIAIRFESKFAEIMETYFLELVEVLKLMNKKNTPATSAETTKQFMEFLQISSLQLELHAKEMLGVLALDKALINLTRSSVYRSNGVADALNSLATQYREEVVGQWFSLLTRLDVSIGRPVSTARRILTNWFGRPESPNPQ